MTEILLVVLFLGLLIASYRDIQIREVPDMVSYGLIIVGLLGGLLLALVYEDAWIFVEHLAGFGVGLLLGVIMYYGRQWGGGDAKLIMGVGAILGLSFENYSLIEFIILLILFGAVYGLVYTLVLAVINRKKFVQGWKEHIRKKHVHRVRWGLVISGVLLLILLFFVPFQMKIMIVFFMAGLYLLTYIWVTTKVIEKHVMTKSYKVSKLTEGDWLAADVKRGKKLIVEGGGTGVTLKDIAKLKKAKIKTVLVREGIPFVPSFMLAFIALLLLQWFGFSLLGWL